MDEFVATNPATGKEIERFAAHGEAEVETRLAAAAAEQGRWRRRAAGERCAALAEVARVLGARRDALAARMTAEMGKPIAQGLAEVDKCAWVCRHYAGGGEDLLASEAVTIEGARARVSRRPLGVILGVMPWHFPLWQVCRFAVPTLVAGNAVVVKHASNVPGCAADIEAVFEAAGMPPGLYRDLRIRASRVAAVIRDRRVAGVSLTGSRAAGAAVASVAADAIKPTLLELGGSDPFIVFADADLEGAVRSGVTSRCLNSGQSCIAAKRFIVSAAVADEFKDAVLAAADGQRVGDPTEPETDIGPLARTSLRDQLAEQIARSVSAGAKLLRGGSVSQLPGAWYPVTVLDGVTPGMPAFDEETFGPALAIVRAHDDDHAIELANRHRYGLGAAVFTRDVVRGQHIAEFELEAGCCAVNDFVRSDPRLPFGGIKESGYGRELGAEGIRAFVNIKTVVVAD